MLDSPTMPGEMRVGGIIQCGQKCEFLNDHAQNPRTAKAQKMADQ